MGVTSVRFTGGEPLLARHLEEVVAAAAALRPRPEISLTTNGVGLARRAGPRRTGPRQHLAGQRGPGTFCGHHPPRPARRRAGRLGRRQRSGSDAGEGERGARPRHRTRGRRAVAAVLPRIRLPAARHRTDAAGRGAPMAAGRRAECRRGAGGAAQAFSAASRPRTARIGSGPAVAGRHRPGNARRRIRCHRVGLARVLLDLRPHPVDGRRADPQLPVLDAGDGSARAAARRRSRRRRRGGVARRDVGQARRSRHQRPELHPARPPDERDRWLARWDASRSRPTASQ
ncbi:molybdenum cofactor biosynthesis protein A [Mycobacterium avium subsp. paratuberculosis S5]|nr:molybdenum cofactor biosynthesis protein A [Mycobacterium avium subsp. paratuberculosis S5]